MRGRKNINTEDMLTRRVLIEKYSSENRKLFIYTYPSIKSSNPFNATCFQYNVGEKIAEEYNLIPNPYHESFWLINENTVVATVCQHVIKGILIGKIKHLFCYN